MPRQISQDKSAKPTLRQGKHIQDYVVPPFLKWLDGIASADGKVSQVVAATSGSGYSLEAQITRPGSIGGIQFEMIPTKRKPAIRTLIVGNGPLQLFLKNLSHRTSVTIVI